MYIGIIENPVGNKIKEWKESVLSPNPPLWEKEKPVTKLAFNK
jgi:hypothetical protein